LVKNLETGQMVTAEDLIASATRRADPYRYRLSQVDGIKLVGVEAEIGNEEQEDQSEQAPEKLAKSSYVAWWTVAFAHKI
jgi:hypothetical protein